MLLQSFQRTKLISLRLCCRLPVLGWRPVLRAARHQVQRARTRHRHLRRLLRLQLLPHYPRYPIPHFPLQQAIDFLSRTDSAFFLSAPHRAVIPIAFQFLLFSTTRLHLCILLLLQSDYLSAQTWGCRRLRSGRSRKLRSYESNLFSAAIVITASIALRDQCASVGS